MPSPTQAILEANRHLAGTERRLHVYAKGETVPNVPQGAWQVCRGLVQLSTLYASGEEGLLGWVGPAMWFGSGLTYLQSYQAKALSDVYLIWYSQAEIEASPTLSQHILPQLSQRLRQTEALLAIAGQRRVEDRLCHLLLLLKQEFGQQTENGTRLSIRLTHQDIASAIGSSRVTITRLLGKLQQEGKIALDAKRHVTLKSDALVAPANALLRDRP